MGVAYRVLLAQPTLEEVQAIRKNPNMRLTASPMGMTREELEKFGPRVYPSDAVPWKGKKGDKFIAAAVGHGALAEANQLAANISMRYAGIKGAKFDPDTGKYMPIKCIKQRDWRKEHPDLASWYDANVAPKMKKGKPKVYWVTKI